MNPPEINNDAQTSTSTELDCAVCLQKCHHPTQLPCGHVFCFLCVKGVAIQNRKCAMCRALIPPDYFDHPVLLEKLTLKKEAEKNSPEESQWYYEGSNGWWKYDERSNEELESAWNDGATECALLLAGAVYSIDFHTMVQTRRNNTTRRRRVKRDTPSLPSKGIAGIKIVEETKTETEMANPLNSQSVEPLEDNNETTINSEIITADETIPDPNENDVDIVTDYLNSLILAAPTPEQEDT